MAYRLRYLSQDLVLPIGEFVVGRSTDCQLSLDDPLVSRRHAVLRVRAGGVTVQDLGSRNGVLVNGTKIEGEKELAAGDKVSIGGQDMVLHTAEDNPRAAANNEEVYRRATQTLGAAYVMELRNAAAEAAAPGSSAPGSNPANAAVADPPTASADGSRSIQSFMLLGGVADKALAMGRAEEAERILQAMLLDVLARAQNGPVDPALAEQAARYAARLGGATTKGSWVDYAFELYKRLGRVLPASVVDELYTVVRKVKSVDVALFRAYLVLLRAQAPSFGPAERFLFQRIEGLERLVVLK